MNQPQTFSFINHVGLTVTDLDKAIQWYTVVLGFELIGGPDQFTSEVPAVARAFREILDDNWNSLKVAYLATQNGTGLELFEFQSPPSQKAAAGFEYWKTGFFHIGITTPDIDAVAETIVRAGGKQRTQPITFTPDGCRYSYCEDPFGNVIELNNRSFERFHANRA